MEELLQPPPPPPIVCSVPNCAWSTPDGCPGWSEMVTLLKIHADTAHPAVNTSNPTAHLEKLPRPTFTLEMSEAEWNFKIEEWNAYIGQTQSDERTKVKQLRAACDEALARRVHDAGGFQSYDTETKLIERLQKLAVRMTHKTLHFQNMWSMIQSPEESIRAYCSRLVGAAELCDLYVTCPREGCNTRASFSDFVVLHVLLKGMADQEIRTRVLSRTQNKELETLEKVVEYISAEECSSESFARMPSTIASSRSTYKKTKSQIRQDQYPPGPSTMSPTFNCTHCGSNHNGDKSAASRQRHCKAFNRQCTSCHRMHHLAIVCKSKKAAAMTTDETNSYTQQIEEIYNGGIIIVSNRKQVVSQVAALNSVNERKPIAISHIIHDIYAGWKKQAPKESPTIPMIIKIDRKSYITLKLPVPRASLRNFRSKPIIVCLDTGAQLTIIPTSVLESLGVKKENLFPVLTGLNAVNGSPIDIIGGILLTFEAVNPSTGVTRITQQLAYVTDSVPHPFLSREACIDLGVIPQDFPSIGSFGQPIVAGSCINTGVPNSSSPPCNCPVRQLPPTTPAVLPCSPTVENLPIIRQYIIDRYASSAFNTCEQQPLPLMENSPPLRLFVNPDAEPKAVHTPANIPKLWVDDVKAGLDRDVRLGVLEKVPVNTPVKWCSRMVVTPKQDGSPRRVVDYQAINKYCPRQTHHTQSPWHIASSVPARSKKTVLDAWHGYHSVPIHPADRPLTQFVTCWGRYQYKTTPQGFISAGDGYSQRSDEIIGEHKNHKKCVDDSIIWNDSIEENFYSVCDFLTKCSNGGIIFNSKKFQFAEDEVNYLGFNLTTSGIKPNKDFIENIRSFPSPKSITDIRSWFGAINQISYTFATSQTMLPFKQLLRPQVPFYWSTELEEAFKKSKEEIVAQCMKGVKMFDISAPTGLATDWSKHCMGFWLTQKHCRCSGPVKLGCCKTGWQTIYCGSRFNSGAESRYHPIEGEAAAAVYGLEKCRQFLLGNSNVLLALDHKPLIKIFGNCPIEDIKNPRLFNFKQRSLPFSFTPVHVPGKKHVVPDTLSRRHDSSESNVKPQYTEEMGPPNWVSASLIAALGQQATTHLEEEESENLEAIVGGLVSSRWNLFYDNVSNALAASNFTTGTEVITWDKLEQACAQCPIYKKLHATVQNGVPENRTDWDVDLLPYYPHRDMLLTLGPVVLLNERPVIPRSLRPRIIEHIHAGHPGLSRMCERVSTTMYWPNYKEDLVKSKLSCSSCNINAPSNPVMPPNPPTAPSYPFQSIVSDMFSFAGKTFVAIADRYSNWLNIRSLPRDTSKALISVLRDYFATYGIPELLSSDGATIYTSQEFKDFCRRFGVEQRISSAYFPHSNKRAELAVKSAKRIIRDSLGPGKDLDSDAVTRALIAHRNTPDPESGLSPSQIIFGRELRGFVPTLPFKYVPKAEWREVANHLEQAHMKRSVKMEAHLNKGSRRLPPLQEGDRVSIQDQSGNNPRRWSKTGIVIDVLDHDSYNVKVDGSNKFTKRNRQFLRKHIGGKIDSDHPRQPLYYLPKMSDRVLDDPEVDVKIIEDDCVNKVNKVPDEGSSDLQHITPEESTSGIEILQTVQPPVEKYSTVVTGPNKTPDDPKTVRNKWVPPPPGVPHYDVLRQMEEEARRQAQSSKKLVASMSSILNMKASTSSEVGGIYSSATTTAHESGGAPIMCRF